MTVGEDSVQYIKHTQKKHCFIVAAILFLMGKIILT